jgi:bifunctional non-homologous end joining protein LigD
LAALNKREPSQLAIFVDEQRQVFGRLQPLKIAVCPFVNLPETHKGRWGDGLTVEDMEKCVWVRPELVAQIEFLEWTESNHLRHSKFAGLRVDKNARSVVKELGS